MPESASMMAAPEWVLVSGGFHFRGGMDRANAALATFLLDEGRRVHLVGYDIDASFEGRPNVSIHRVDRPSGSFLLAGPRLRRTGMAVAREVTGRNPLSRVVVNGGNCPWPDINWVHSVHAAWPCSDAGAPLWFRIKNRIFKRLAKLQERRALGVASQIIANSESTKTQLVEMLHVNPDRVSLVYLGSDAGVRPPTAAERASGRSSLGLSEGGKAVLFLGALGYDTNKGLDILWRAWEMLTAQGNWDFDLLVAGGGNAVSLWRDRARAAAFRHRVHVLGFSTQVPSILAACDLLVSPVRYEAYGLNVQEALLRNIPTIVSRTAGIATRLLNAGAESMLTEKGSVEMLVARLRDWQANTASWEASARSVGALLRGHTWTDMSQQFVTATGVLK